MGVRYRQGFNFLRISLGVRQRRTFFFLTPYRYSRFLKEALLPYCAIFRTLNIRTSPPAPGVYCRNPIFLAMINGGDDAQIQKKLMRIFADQDPYPNYCVGTGYEQLCKTLIKILITFTFLHGFLFSLAITRHILYNTDLKENCIKKK